MGRIRYAVIDIGTNSCLLTVMENGSPPEVITDEAKITKLGEGLSKSCRLTSSAIERTLAAVLNFISKAEDCGVSKNNIVVVGTSAIRDAQNSNELISQFPLQVRVLSGEQEANYSFLSVSKDPLLILSGELAVIDIGGGSTEIIVGEGSQIKFSHSFDVGAIKVTEKFFTESPISFEARLNASNYIDKMLSEMDIKFNPLSAVGVGGSFTNLASIKLGLAKFDQSIIHDTLLTYEEISRAFDNLATLNIEQRKKVVGIEPDRAEVLPAGALVLERVLNHLNLEEVTVSTYGLRFGLLRELIEADSS